jgi:hypothetical protein
MTRSRKLKAVYDPNSIRVYQLCTAEDAQRALRENSLGHFSSQKEIWIQPSFGWSVVRSGYDSRMHAIQIDITEEGVLQMLEDSRLSQFQPSSAHPAKQGWVSRRESSAVIAQWELIWM